MIDAICGSDGRFTVKLHGHLLDRFNDKRGVREARKFKSREAAEKAARYQNDVNHAVASLERGQLETLIEGKGQDNERSHHSQSA